MACDVLDAIGVEGLLAFSAVLLEVNLQHRLVEGVAVFKS